MYIYNKFNKNFKINFNINFFFKNYFSWHKKFLIWQFFFSGFYFDELFSKLVKKIFTNFLSFPSFFFLDKWFSFWTGSGGLKKKLKIYTNFFYFENLSYFFFFILLLFSLFFFYIIFFILFFFF